MDLTQLANLGEFIGGVAVLATLVYLAVQVRQNTTTVRAQSQLESARMWSQQNIAGALDPDILRIIEMGLYEPRGLDEDEQRQFVWWMANHFFMAEGFFHSHRMGLLSDESWEAHERLVRGVLNYDAVAGWWKSGITPFSASFHAHVEGLRRTGGEARWNYPRVQDIFGEL